MRPLVARLLLLVALVASTATLVVIPGGVAKANEGKPAAELGLREVQLGVYVGNIQTIDLATNSYSADFYVWLRWKNPLLTPWQSLEIMNSYESWALSVTPAYEEPQLQSDGTYVWSARYQGNFNTPLSVANYPFEEQNLHLIIEDNVESREQLVFVPDPDGVRMDPTITLPGYDLGTPSMTIEDFQYSTTFGEYGATPLDHTYSRVVVEVPLASPVASGIVKTIIPLLLVAASAALALLIPVAHMEARISVAITGLLTLVAMQLGVISSLPDVSYLTLLDLLYLASFAFSVAILGGTVYCSWLVKEERLDTALHRDRVILVSVSVVYVLLIAGIFALYIPANWAS